MIIIDGHECFLGDDGTLDTVIIVDGKEFRFSDTSELRNGDGMLKENGFFELCEMAIEEIELMEHCEENDIIYIK